MGFFYPRFFPIKGFYLGIQNPLKERLNITSKLNVARLEMYQQALFPGLVLQKKISKTRGSSGLSICTPCNTKFYQTLYPLSGNTLSDLTLSGNTLSGHTLSDHTLSGHTLSGLYPATLYPVTLYPATLYPVIVYPVTLYPATLYPVTLYPPRSYFWDQHCLPAAKNIWR